MFKNKPRLTFDKSSPNRSSSSPLPSQAMLPTVTTTSQAITLADSEYAQKRREIYKLLKKLSDLVGYVPGVLYRTPHDALRYSRHVELQCIERNTNPSDSGRWKSVRYVVFPSSTRCRVC